MYVNKEAAPTSPPSSGGGDVNRMMADLHMQEVGEEEQSEAGLYRQYQQYQSTQQPYTPQNQAPPQQKPILAPVAAIGHPHEQFHYAPHTPSSDTNALGPRDPSRADPEYSALYREFQQHSTAMQAEFTADQETERQYGLTNQGY